MSTPLTVERLALDVAAAPGVDRGRGDPSTLRLCFGPLWRFRLRRGQLLIQRLAH